MLRILVLSFLVTSCVGTDPSGWRAEQHFFMEKGCRVVCYPNGVKKYQSMDGSCECHGRGTK
jgi:hypothetical protein